MYCEAVLFTHSGESYGSPECKEIIFQQAHLFQHLCVLYTVYSLAFIISNTSIHSVHVCYSQFMCDISEHL